ncbi:hypothetical protein CEV31_2866 [Brucella thiophenivorans]|uniref:Uncharacterized protein n=1 Tax=Brucella thiophenivorans TaxID=571255 RepID=A0A256FJZ9_9HYPH|nr:hypothetical protein CEV31_2866 [Brucella thiophenivorans]
MLRVRHVKPPDRYGIKTLQDMPNVMSCIYKVGTSTKKLLRH